MPIAWTDPRVEMLKKLCAERLRYREIARRMSAEFGVKFTKNACLGKAGRLGLDNGCGSGFPKSKLGQLGGRARAAQIRAQRRPRKTPIMKPIPRFSVDPFVPSQEELVIPLAERKTVLMLTDKSCRWPIGDPQHPEFHFCGKEKIKGISYCEFHARKAFQPPVPRTRSAEASVNEPSKVLEEV